MDECAVPIPIPQSVRQRNVPTKSKPAPALNRFELLSMNGLEDESSGEDIGTNYKGSLAAIASTLGGVTA